MPRSWDLSPDAELDEALKWFRRRVPIGSTDFDALQENARRQAFWMAKVATAQRAKRIQDSLAEALKQGQSFAVWKKANRGILQRVPKAHLETAFRSWAQTAYNQARIGYMSQPAVIKRRPHWIFDAVIDGRTTPVCTAYNGTVLPAGHPWWATHTPPLHHNCRSTIRALTRRQADKLGIRKRAPADKLTKKAIAEAGAEDVLKPQKVAPGKGFGAPVIEPWQPKAKSVPRGLRRIIKRPELLKVAMIAAAIAALREGRENKGNDGST